MKKITENKSFILDRPIQISFKYYIKRLLLPFIDIFYKTILTLKPPNKTKKKYYISICGIFKDEALSLKEWIEFHRIIGVDHFYLYNNFSTDNFKEILHPYINDGILTFIDWTVEQGQFLAYENFYKNYRNETQWVSFLDLDEFICPYYETSLAKWISQYEKYPCILLYWKMFGTSGLLTHDSSKLITEQYIVSWNKLDSIGKVLLNTDYQISRFDGSMHHATRTKILFWGHTIIIPPINEFRKFIEWDIHRTGLHKLEDFTIQINHYWSKSFLTYYKKKNKGAPCPNYAHTMEQFYWHEHHNSTTDYKIFRFLIDLKIALGMTKNLENK